MAAGENRNGNDEIALLIDCVKCRFICVPFPAPHPALVCPAPRPLGVAAYYSEENMLLKARQKKEEWESPFADRVPQGNPFFRQRKFVGYSLSLSMC